MAQIVCPNCQREVADQAVCPSCGYLLPAAIRAPISNLDDRVLEMLACEGKIAAIKFYRELVPNIGLAEAKEYVDRLESERPYEYSSPRDGRLGGWYVGCLYVLIFLLLAFALWVIPLLLHRAPP